MKVELDEEIPVSLVRVLVARGHDVTTVTAECLVGQRDREVWGRCQTEGRLIITLGSDFSVVRQFQTGTHAGIVLVRLQQPGRVGLANALS